MSGDRSDRLSVDGHQPGCDPARINVEAGRARAVDDAQPHPAALLDPYDVRIVEGAVVAATDTLGGGTVTVRRRSPSMRYSYSRVEPTISVRKLLLAMVAAYTWGRTTW